MRKIRALIIGLVIMVISLVLTACDNGAHTHTWGEWEITTPPACTSKGEETRVCAGDKTHTETREIAAKGHDAGEWITTLDPTCTEAGTKELRCTIDRVVLDTDIIPALGHEWGEWTITTAPTCTSKGEVTRECANDPAHMETRNVEAHGHDAGVWVTTLEPTCTETGKKELRCTVEDAILDTKTIPALGHEWGEWTITTAPTCTSKGEETRVCANDPAHTETRNVEAHGHDAGVWVTTLEPTCTETGNKELRCTVDDAILDIKTISALGHAWGEWAVTTQPTMTEYGEKTRVCENDPTHTEKRVVEKLPAIAESITVANGNSLTVTDKIDATVQLSVKIKYVYGGTDKTATSDDVTYTSNNHSVATVDTNGLITIVSPGDAKIYIDSVYNNAQGGKIRQTVSLKVNHLPTENLTLKSCNSYSMIRGLTTQGQGITNDTAQIELNVKYSSMEEQIATAADVTFKSSNEAVASVNVNGQISFNGLGTCVITVMSRYSTKGGEYMSKTIDVEVKRPVNNTGLEVVSFGNGNLGDEVVIRNVSNSPITSRIADAYYLDSSGKILGSITFLLVQSVTPITIEPGQEVTDSIWRTLPVGTTEIFIYNERIN